MHSGYLRITYVRTYLEIWPKVIRPPTQLHGAAELVQIAHSHCPVSLWVQLTPLLFWIHPIQLLHGMQRQGAGMQLRRGEVYYSTVFACCMQLLVPLKWQ